MSCVFVSSFLMASLRSHVQTKGFSESGSNGEGTVTLHNSNYDGNSSKVFPTDGARSGSPAYTRSYGEAQLEIFHHRHGLLILHLLSALMFVPSLVAWLQVWWINPKIKLLFFTVILKILHLYVFVWSAPKVRALNISFVMIMVHNNNGMFTLDNNSSQLVWSSDPSNTQIICTVNLICHPK